MFKKAVRKNRKLRMALCGPTGSGKTYSALSIARGIGGRVALIDTERHSASLYADDFDFDACDLESGHPEAYIEAIEGAARAGYDVLIIDSFSHAWMGEEGALALVDEASKRTKGNSYVAWREVTPLHNRLVNAVLDYPGHIIVTMRSKMAYEMVEEKGKKEVRKLGLQPIQRDGVEYEFDVVGDMTEANEFIISKTRAKFLRRAVIDRPGAKLGSDLAAWLNSGEADAPTEAPEAPPTREERKPAPQTKPSAPKSESKPAQPGAERAQRLVNETLGGGGQTKHPAWLEAMSPEDLKAVRVATYDALESDLAPKVVRDIEYPPKSLEAARIAVAKLVEAEHRDITDAAKRFGVPMSQVEALLGRPLTSGPMTEGDREALRALFDDAQARAGEAA